jgi:hypothetical protein
MLYFNLVSKLEIKRNSATTAGQRVTFHDPASDLGWRTQAAIPLSVRQQVAFRDLVVQDAENRGLRHVCSDSFSSFLVF